MYNIHWNIYWNIYQFKAYSHYYHASFIHAPINPLLHLLFFISHSPRRATLPLRVHPWHVLFHVISFHQRWYITTVYTCKHINFEGSVRYCYFHAWRSLRRESYKQPTENLKPHPSIPDFKYSEQTAGITVLIYHGMNHSVLLLNFSSAEWNKNCAEDGKNWRRDEILFLTE